MSQTPRAKVKLRFLLIWNVFLMSLDHCTNRLTEWQKISLSGSGQETFQQPVSSVRSIVNGDIIGVSLYC